MIFPLHIRLPGLMLTLLLTITSGCYKEIPVRDNALPEEARQLLSLDDVEGMVDNLTGNIMFTIGGDSLPDYAPEISFGNYSAMELAGKDIVNGAVNHLGPVVVNHPYLLLARKDQMVDTFRVLFTTLPLVHILSGTEIPDEPKVLAHIQIQYCNKGEDASAVHYFQSYAGIEIRGRNSTRYDKKSYGLELWKNESGKDVMVPLLGMRYGEDWILDAMYVDQLRMRNKLAFQVWETIGSVPEQDGKKGVYPGIRCRYVELFLNNNYSGIYCLGEKLDEKLLHFAPDQDEKGGVLYKAIDWANGSTRFETSYSEPSSQMVWDGWELIYPDDRPAWEPLAQLKDFVVNSGDSDFRAEIASWFDIKNAIDYYLFINLLLAYDNAGKNTFLARYTGQGPFFIMPWDAEGSWGRMWDGSDANTFGILENHIIYRLLATDADDFNNRVKTTWKRYRSSRFSKETLMKQIDQNYSMLLKSGAYDRENLRWNVSIDPQQEYAYMTGWLEARLDYLDEYFDD